MSIRRSPLAGFPPLALSACVPSLHRFYATRDIAFEPMLIGAWLDRKRHHVWEFSRTNGQRYRLVHGDEENRKSEFVVHLFRIDGMLCLDLWPWAFDSSLNPLHALHVVPAHNAMLVRQIVPALQIAFLSYTSIRRQLEKNPTAIAHARPEDDEYVLTALPHELQRFIVHHDKTTRAGIFENVFELERGEPHPT